MQATYHTPISTINNSITSTTSSSKIGPRAKCSQVVYEAIAKACEIIVRSRCNNFNNNKEKSMNHPKTATATSTSTRFNIEIEEIIEVRNILQRWRRSLHVPVQLDIILEDSSSDNKDGRNILLERWCIDYEESTLKEEHQQQLGASASTTIPQLRQVCKRVVILLRTLHCMTKLLPSYHLVVDGYNNNSKGYYNNVTQSNIKYSIHAGNNHANDSQDLSHGNSNTSNYDKYQFIAIPTPYGNLRISVLYMPKVLQPPLSLSSPVSIESHTTSPIIATTDNNKSNASEEEEKRIHKSPLVIPEATVTAIGAPKERVLSGLSLALLGQQNNDNEQELKTETTSIQQQQQCYSSDNEDEQHHHNNLFETKHKSPPAFLRMHSLDERSSNYLDKHHHYHNKSLSSRSSTPSSHNNYTTNQHLHNIRGRKVDRSPITSEHSKGGSVRSPFVGAASASPPLYLSNHHMSSSNEYGYAYNNIKTRPIIIKKTPSFTSQHPMSASPPFSRSPALSAMPTPPCLSSTPPFLSNPTCLQSSNSLTRRSFTNPNIGADSDLPSPLTVLQASPFHSDPSSFLANSTSMLAVDKSSILTNPTSASNNTATSNSYLLQPHSSLLDQQLHSHHDLNDGADIDNEDNSMPFANITDDLNTNNSIYNEKSMESASTFAHKCATTAATTKLQFNNDQYYDSNTTNTIDNNSNSSSIQQQQLNVHDLIHQLQDFHTFGASLNGSCSTSATPK